MAKKMGNIFCLDCNAVKFITFYLIKILFTFFKYLFKMQNKNISPPKLTQVKCKCFISTKVYILIELI